ncbi:MAG: signal peptidase I [Candidatus Kerfeldbacteria bacterium]|nr:signal peptidase I [Candidatus Kerfeldbacteria bacterium]
MVMNSNPKTTPKPEFSNPPRRPLQRHANVVPSFTESVGSFVVEVAKVVVIALAIIIPVRYFLIQPFYVKGASMEPNFYDNEYLVIDEVSYRFHAPNRGDVVVIRNPRRESDFLIKRVIGLPGERVEIINSGVNIYNGDNPNGFTIDESSYLTPDVRTHGTLDVKLGPNEFFVLGDNRDSSLDSRYLGPVEKRNIVGRAWVRAWPVTRLSIFSSPKYSD